MSILFFGKRIPAAINARASTVFCPEAPLVLLFSFSTWPMREEILFQRRPCRASCRVRPGGGRASARLEGRRPGGWRVPARSTACVSVSCKSARNEGSPVRSLTSREATTGAVNAPEIGEEAELAQRRWAAALAAAGTRPPHCGDRIMRPLDVRGSYSTISVQPEPFTMCYPTWARRLESRVG